MTQLRTQARAQTNKLRQSPDFVPFKVIIHDEDGLCNLARGAPCVTTFAQSRYTPADRGAYHR